MFQCLDIVQCWQLATFCHTWLQLGVFVRALYLLASFEMSLFEQSMPYTSDLDIKVGGGWLLDSGSWRAQIKKRTQRAVIYFCHTIQIQA